MQGSHAGRLGGFLKIFVAFQTNRHSDLGFGSNRGRRSLFPHHRPRDPKNMPAATHRHAFSQGDLGGHAQRQFDFGAFRKRRVRKQKNSAGAQVLGESHALDCSSTLPDGNREQISESLAHTAFHSNWRSGHSALTSLPRRRKLQEDTLAYAGRQEKLQVSKRHPKIQNPPFPCTWRPATGFLLSRKSRLAVEKWSVEIARQCTIKMHDIVERKLSQAHPKNLTWLNRTLLSKTLHDQTPHDQTLACPPSLARAARPAGRKPDALCGIATSSSSSADN